MGPAHFAIGLAAKPATPKIPLWVLLVASEFIDLLSIALIGLGLERMSERRTTLANGIETIVPGSLPWSHGLFMSVVWSVLASALAYLVFKDRRSSGVIGLVVFSHWVLDFIVHPGTLPLFFEGSPTVGLGMWASGPGFIASMVLEVALIAGGLAIYFNYRKRKKVTAGEVVKAGQ